MGKNEWRRERKVDRRTRKITDWPFHSDWRLGFVRLILPLFPWLNRYGEDVSCDVRDHRDDLEEDMIMRDYRDQRSVAHLGTVWLLFSTMVDRRDRWADEEHTRQLKGKR